MNSVDLHRLGYGDGYGRRCVKYRVREQDSLRGQFIDYLTFPRQQMWRFRLVHAAVGVR